MLHLQLLARLASPSRCAPALLLSERAADTGATRVGTTLGGALGLCARHGLRPLQVVRLVGPRASGAEHRHAAQSALRQRCQEATQLKTLHGVQQCIKVSTRCQSSRCGASGCPCKLFLRIVILIRATKVRSEAVPTLLWSCQHSTASAAGRCLPTSVYSSSE